MAKLEDLREWLLDRIDGGEEMRGEDGLISDFIRQIDALPSEMGTIPDAERKKVMTAHMLAESIVERATVATPRTDAAEVTMLRLDGDADVVVDAYFARTLERELSDLKQRLLPQFQGRAQRAEHERDGMLEKLIVHQTTIANLHDVIDGMRNSPSATAAPVDHSYDRTASLSAGKYVCTCGGACSRFDASRPSPTTKEKSK